MILVCGEALIDLFMRPNVGDGAILEARAGGSPLNVASGAARLGVPSAFLGGVSTDHFGELLMRTALGEGIDMSMAKRTPRPTPFVAVTPDHLGHPTYTFYAHQTAEGDVDIPDLPAQLSPSIGAIAMGSFALALEPIGASLLALAQREGGQRVISLDPNLRPTMVGPVALWRERFDAVAQCAAIIKLSEEDFVGGWGNLANAEAVAERYLSQGVQLVIMTRGAAGASAWWSGGQLTLPGRAISMVDAVGAGDSFHAGLLARLAHRGMLDRSALARLDRTIVADTVGYAIAAASITCGRRGADLPRRAEVEKIFGPD